MPKRDTSRRFFRVLISHNGLDAGETFGVDPEDFGWWQSVLEAGYVEEITPEVSDAGQEGNG